jgi:hypothetical protein
MDLSQKASNLETILYEFSPVPTARSGQESIAQGSPWVRQKKALLAASGQGFMFWKSRK